MLTLFILKKFKAKIISFISDITERPELAEVIGERINLLLVNLKSQQEPAYAPQLSVYRDESKPAHNILPVTALKTQNKLTPPFADDRLSHTDNNDTVYISEEPEKLKFDEGIKKQANLILAYLKMQSELGQTPRVSLILEDSKRIDNILSGGAGKTQKGKKPLVYFYRDDDGKWVIGEEGNEERFDEMDGFIYIHELRQCSDTDIASDILCDEGKIFPVSVIGEIYSGMSDEQLEKNEPSLRHGKPGERIPVRRKFKRPTKEEKKRRNMELQIEEDALNHDITSPYEPLDEAYEENQMRLEAIKYERAILNYNEEHDLTPSEDDARDDVQKAIKRAKQKIFNKMPYMKGYLKYAIHTGEFCSYESGDCLIDCEWKLFK